MSNSDFDKTNSTLPSTPVSADDALLASIRQELDRSCSALDGQTLSRLHRIRSAAIERRPSRLQAMLLPFSGLVTACALVVAVSLNWNGGLQSEPAADSLEDIEILAANEALDFYAEYEFYQWLAQE
ncbi:MAG: hypothetical protein V4603_14545 [Pseudomonadota bacterium]